MKQTAIFVLAMLTIWVLVIKNAQKDGNDSMNAPMSHGVSDGYSTIVIDSCEYIDAFSRLAHKGNCKFCAEKRKKVIQDLIKQLNK